LEARYEGQHPGGRRRERCGLAVSPTFSPRGAARDICANSGEDALDKLAGGVEPTLIAILSDINMLGMDGLDLLGEVKRRYPELPVMMD
jgi:CheY-like chemotaxis protein